AWYWLGRGGTRAGMRARLRFGRSRLPWRRPARSAIWAKLPVSEFGRPDRPGGELAGRLRWCGAPALGHKSDRPAATPSVMLDGDVVLPDHVFAGDPLVAAGVDNHRVATPIGVTPAPKRRDDTEPGAEGDPRTDRAAVETGRRRDVDRRCVPVGPVAVDFGRVVDRHVDHVGVGRLDDDVGILLADRDLRCRFELP